MKNDDIKPWEGEDMKNDDLKPWEGGVNEEMRPKTVERGSI